MLSTKIAGPVKTKEEACTETLVLSSLKQALNIIESERNPSKEYINTLIYVNAKHLVKDVQISKKLMEESAAYWMEARESGCVSAENQQAVNDLIVKLAQNGEEQMSHRRDVLTMLAREMKDTPLIPPLPPPEAQGEPVHIDYCAEKNILRIEMPGILPLRTTKGNQYLPAKIRHHMTGFMKERIIDGAPQIRISPAFVVFAHHYLGGANSPKLKDYDNLERKRVLDALQCTSIFYDNPAVMVFLDLMVEDTRDFTEVLVAPFAIMNEVISELDFGVYHRISAPDSTLNCS